MDLLKTMNEFCGCNMHFGTFLFTLSSFFITEHFQIKTKRDGLRKKNMNAKKSYAKIFAEKNCAVKYCFLL